MGIEISPLLLIYTASLGGENITDENQERDRNITFDNMYDELFGMLFCYVLVNSRLCELDK